MISYSLIKMKIRMHQYLLVFNEKWRLEVSKAYSSFDNSFSTIYDINIGKIKYQFQKNHNENSTKTDSWNYFKKLPTKTSLQHQSNTHTHPPNFSLLRLFVTIGGTTQCSFGYYFKARFLVACSMLIIINRWSARIHFPFHGTFFYQFNQYQ